MHIAEAPLRKNSKAKKTKQPTKAYEQQTQKASEKNKYLKLWKEVQAHLEESNLIVEKKERKIAALESKMKLLYQQKLSASSLNYGGPEEENNFKG